MNHIIIDLEFTPIGDPAIRNNLRQEIIEIGAVRLDDNYEYVDRFEVYVQPQLTSLSPHISRLTGIDKCELRNAPCFEKALDMFKEWIGTDKFRIYQWSENDKSQIVKECRYKGILDKQSMLCNKYWRDIQRLYTRVFHKCRKPSLESALAELAADFEGKMHSAGDDAMNTAWLLQVMAVREKYEQATKTIKSIMEAPQNRSTLGDIIGVDLNALYALCEAS
jgi:inhibitor of KinA sporulation pathway (predicted exonuclease)